MEVLKNRVCLVTGAASGIGLACAQRFAAEGAAVMGLDLEESDEWRALEAPGGKEFRAADVRDGTAQEAAAQALHAAFGRIDVLLTAAGTAAGGTVHQVEESEWDRVLDINLKGTFLSCRAVLPVMMEQRCGSIITIASIEGLEGSEGGSAYNASKGAVVLLTRNMAMDYGRLGIRANAICPGFIDTPMSRAVFAMESMNPIREKIQHQHKLGRFGKPEEIAGAALFLASDDSSFISGQAIPVDGGFTAGHSFGIAEMLGLV